MPKKGYKQTEEHKEKIKKTMMGKTNRKGKKHPHSLATKKKISFSMTGEKNHQWIDGRKANVSEKEYDKTRNLRIFEIRAGRKKPDKCELCGKKRELVFDHDHRTEEFRGWICRKCNTALGMVEDDINILALMIEYIKNNNPRF